MNEEVKGNNESVMDQLKRLQEQYEKKSHGACPTCGHCPTCGRGSYDYAPWPNMPWWSGGQVYLWSDQQRYRGGTA